MENSHLKPSSFMGSGQRDNEYSQMELETIDSYVRNGGRVLFLGEHVSPTNPDRNGSMRTALDYMGSSLSIGSDSFDPVKQTAFGEQIIQHPLTDGVTSLVYAAANSISGGTPILYCKDLQTPFFAYERIGEGFVLASGDLQITPGIMGQNDGNDIFFRNLTVAIIPEPNSAILLIVGASAIFAYRGKNLPTRRSSRHGQRPF